jgi:NADPH-dependent glutamate synthase beta subunit-like oxidoreductase
MEELKAQIKLQSSTAAQLSQEAVGAFAARDFATGKALIQQAVEGGRNCQKLIEQYNQTSQLKNKG